MNHKTLQQSAMLLFGGAVASLIGGAFHSNLGQFAGMLLIVAGLLGLFALLDVESGKPGWSGRVGPASAVVALALYGVQQTGDEGGYHSLMLGLAFGLGGVAIDQTPGVPKLIGLLMALSGIASMIQRWVPGSAAPRLVSIVTVVVWSGWLLVIARAARRSAR